MDKISADLTTGFDILVKALTDRRIPGSIPHEIRETWTYTLLMGLGISLLAMPGIRRFTFQTAESVLAVILLLLLMGIVLGMPFGGSYYYSLSVLLSAESCYYSQRLACAKPPSQYCDMVTI